MYDRLFMNLSASDIYAIVDVMRWEAHLSESFVYSNYRILQVDDARSILRRIAQADVNTLDELVHAFISPCFETRNFPDDYLIELLERELGEDSPWEDGAPPWGARMYVLQQNQPEWLEYEPERPFDPDALHQAVMAEVRARPKGYVVFEFVTESGAPVSGLRCEVLLADGEFLTRSSDAQGQLQLDNIPQGSCHLRLSSLDGSAWRPESGSANSRVDQARLTAHIVRHGDTLGSIARQHEVKDWNKVWNDSRNALLRDQRKLPNLLRPGDVVAIPVRDIHEIVRQTDATHRVIVSRDPRGRLPWST
jgi:hypothetical protein